VQHFGNQHNRIGGSVARAGRPLATVPEKSVMLTDHHLIQDAASIIVTEKKPGEFEAQYRVREKFVITFFKS
jgi:hypothetical protein